MKVDPKKIRTFHDIELQKTKLRYELKHREAQLKGEGLLFGENLRQSVRNSLMEFAQNTVASVIVKLVTKKRK